MSTVQFGGGDLKKRKVAEPSAEPPPTLRFIQPPCFGSGQWEWGVLYVGSDRGKGSGLFAAVDLPPGLLIPYIGRELPNNHRIKGDSYDFKAYNETFILRADPGGVTPTPECQNSYCVASFANEATAGRERYNCEFVTLPLGGCRAVMPMYPDFMPEHDVFLLTMCTVLKHQPLLAHYGSAYRRDYAAAAAEEVADRKQWNRTNAQYIKVTRRGELIPVDTSIDYEAVCAAPAQ